MKTLGAVIGWFITVTGLGLAAFAAFVVFARHEVVARAMDMQYGGYDLLSNFLDSSPWIWFLFLPPLVAAIVFNPLVFPRLPLAKGFISRFLVATGLSALTLVVAFLAGTFTPSTSARFTEAVAAWKDNSNAAKSVQTFETLARRGDRTAQLITAEAYLEGRGVGQDVGRARDIYEDAFNKDFQSPQRRLWIVNGLYNVALRYGKGDGVEKNSTEAAKLYQKAADAGHEDAQINLAYLYIHGDGVPQNYTKARDMYLVLAEKDNVKALRNLSALYTNGWGVPQDPAQAKQWQDRAETVEADQALEEEEE